MMDIFNMRVKAKQLGGDLADQSLPLSLKVDSVTLIEKRHPA
jgi:hypothetical protein